MTTATKTVMDLVTLSTAYLAANGSDTPRLDAELLVARALAMERLDVYLQFDRPLNPAETDDLRLLVRRRGGGEPMAYILGSREFYGRAFAVSPAVLIPRPETEALVQEALAWAGHRGGPLRILDVGTGSGCIALTLAAELQGAAVVATDVSVEALAMARRNAADLDLIDRVEFRHGSWGDALAGGGEFDIIVSNPPYVTEDEIVTLARDVAQYEPRTALVAGADGLEPYRQLIGVASAHRRATGLVAFEVDPRRAAAVGEMVARAWPEVTPRIVCDLAGRDRVVVSG